MRILESTRSDYRIDDVGAVLTGIAPDGGLFADPELEKRSVPVNEAAGKDSYETAARILREMLPGFDDPEKLVRDAYDGKFSCGEVITPLKQIREDLYILELFHGPTSAFKDVALSLLPHLMAQARQKKEQEKEIVILTATSGDTGKAALEGFRDVPGIRIMVFYPAEGVSEVQRKQMVSQQGGNVRVCAVRGNFDDCQSAVKKAFGELREPALSENVILSSANSINIGRLVPQIFYYYSAYAQLLEMGRIRIGDRVDFVVPTGNFGDILAGYYAKKIGLPVGKLICASNANRILTDFFSSAVYDLHRPFYLTSSPSMDILISSNLERLLYHVSGNDHDMVSQAMKELSEKKEYRISGEMMKRIREDFGAYSADEAETEEMIRLVYRDHGYLMDPHTAVGWSAAQKYEKGREGRNPVVVLSTASPYKFIPAEMRALGIAPSGDPFADMRKLKQVTGAEIPKNLLDLETATERFSDVIDKDEITGYVRRYIGQRSGK